MNTSINSERGESNPDVAFEKRDVNTRAILYFIVTLFAVVALTLISMRGLFGYYSATQKLGPGISPFYNSRELPPTPRLQVDPTVDLDQVRQSQNELLNSYGWADKATGKVRVPIDRAMDMLIERKLPVRTATPAPPSADRAEKEKRQ
jgi:hypothetical protein